jgi:nitrite reductase/ring-hydroxylating ferredoxin subunit
MDEFVKVAKIEEVPIARGLMVDYNGEEVGIFKVDGTCYAIGGICPHRGGPVGEGPLNGMVVTCPWHGWRFDIRTGANTINPSSTVKSYKVKVEGSDVYIAE